MLSKSPVWVVRSGRSPLLLAAFLSHLVLSSASFRTSPASVSSKSYDFYPNRRCYPPFIPMPSLVFRLLLNKCATIWAHSPNFGVAACADRRLSGRVVRLDLVMTARVLCKCHFIASSAAVLMPPFLSRPGLLAMVPTLVASHVVASNWQPRSFGSLSDPAGFDPSRSSAALWENKFEVHPDTPRNDPVFRILGVTSRPLTPR